MLTLIGLLIILTIVVLLIFEKSKSDCCHGPLIGALIAGFGINDI